jgi:hypothetical protein
MSTSIDRAEFSDALLLHPPEGPLFRVTGREIALVIGDGTLKECRFLFEIDPEQYRAAASRGLFHLAPDNRGPGADAFAPTGIVRIEARLDPGSLAEIELLRSDPEAVVRALREASASGRWSPLLETEAWFALHVTTPVPQDIDPEGELRVGYSTVFALDQPPAAGAGALDLPMLNVALEVLESRGVEWEETTDPEVIRAEVASEAGEWTLFVVCREEQRRCSIYSQAPWTTPETSRPAMSELLTRLNYGLALGNFEMDFADGEVRFKTSVDVSGSHLGLAMFEAILDANLAAMDAYLPALEAVRDGRMTPAEAAASIES